MRKAGLIIGVIWTAGASFFLGVNILWLYLMYQVGQTGQAQQAIINIVWYLMMVITGLWIFQTAKRYKGKENEILAKMLH